MARESAPAAESSAEHGHRQTPINGTIQMEVPPASETGEYYILVANLPFGCTWRCLKDFTRTVCQPEYVQVFSNSTCGWVKVLGKENFDKAWNLLNGGEFRGKALIADPGNEKKTIKIKVLADPASAFPAAPQGRNGRVSHPTLQSADDQDDSVAPAPYDFGSPALSTVAPYDGSHSQYLASPALTFVSTTATAYTGTLTYPMVETGPHTIPTPSYAAAGYGQYYATQMSPFGQQSTPYPYPQYQTSDPGAAAGEYYYDGSEQMSYHQPPDAQGSAGSSPRGGHVETESRKVFIRNISRKASKDEVVNVITEFSGVDPSTVESLEVPVDGKSGHSKGHATVTFCDVATSQQAIAAIGQANFLGRSLEARPAVDYLATNPPPKSGDRGGRGGGGSGGGRDARGRSSGGGKSGSSHGNHHHPHDDKKRSSRGKEKENDKPHGNKHGHLGAKDASGSSHSQTMVADGSSGYNSFNRDKEKMHRKK